MTGCWTLFLAFTLVPLAEILVLLQIGSVLGVGWTLALVVVSGALGAALARSQGLSVWQQVHLRLAGGEMPGRELLHGLLLLVAGLVLLTPGFITDITGLALLVPPVREPLIAWLIGRLKKHIERGQISVWYW